ncbi:RRM domain-containing protein [Sarcoptes scabiei]|uniref:RRM domain-containing protein n=1 Tax=Sarcoptes scabiei TaxID=52283 RepID=A0A132A9K9_SARSC|nr:RRM domain-containing protein [Sarcoptes scabiei]
MIHVNQLELLFGLPDDYPEISPEFEIISSTHLTESDQNQIMEILKNVVQDNLGSVMIFALITRAIEWINQLRDFRIEEQRKEEERIQKELEELEQKKFEGTRVTVESFILWKLKFDAEMAALNQKDLKSDSTKLTGKEMFMRDKNLIDSDLCFGENDDLNVKVDESLFANKKDEIDDDGKKIDEISSTVKCSDGKNQERQKRTLFIGNLPANFPMKSIRLKTIEPMIILNLYFLEIFHSKLLREFFNDCGPIQSIRIVRDSQTGIGKGFGYVNFKSNDSLVLALEKNGNLFKNREIRIKAYNYQKDSDKNIAAKKETTKMKKKTVKKVTKSSNEIPGGDFQGEKSSKKLTKKKKSLKVKNRIDRIAKKKQKIAKILDI